MLVWAERKHSLWLFYIPLSKKEEKKKLNEFQEEKKRIDCMADFIYIIGSFTY